MNTISNFWQSLEKAAPYEMQAAKILTGYRPLTDVRDAPEYWDKDIDFITREGDGVEVKIDFTNYARTNLVVETISNKEKNRAGFLYTTEARWLAFYFPNKSPREIYVVSVKKLREYVSKNIRDLKKIYSKTGTDNYRYTSEAVLINPETLTAQVFQLKK